MSNLSLSLSLSLPSSSRQSPCPSLIVAYVSHFVGVVVVKFASFYICHSLLPYHRLYPSSSSTVVQHRRPAPSSSTVVHRRQIIIIIIEAVAMRLTHSCLRYRVLYCPFLGQFYDSYCPRTGLRLDSKCPTTVLKTVLQLS